MGLFTWLFGEPSKDELAMKAAAQKGRVIRDANAQAQFDAMIKAQRNGGGIDAGGVRLTADGQVDLDGFDLTREDVETLELFKAAHNGGFEPSVRLQTKTVDAQTQQQMISVMAGLPPSGHVDPLGKITLDLNKHGSVIARIEDIPYTDAQKQFSERAGLIATDAPVKPVTDEDKAFLEALAKIGAKPREFDMK